MDGPLILTAVTAAGAESTLAPWVRVLRHAPAGDGDVAPSTELYAKTLRCIDVLHSSYLEKYLMQAEAYARDFAARALEKHVVLAEGEGFVSVLGKRWPPPEEMFSLLEQSKKSRRHAG